jgi:hypothetical protein
MSEQGLGRPERAALVLFQKFEVTRPGGVLILSDFLDHADFVGLSRGRAGVGNQCFKVFPLDPSVLMHAAVPFG